MNTLLISRYFGYKLKKSNSKFANKSYENILTAPLSEMKRTTFIHCVEAVNKKYGLNLNVKTLYPLTRGLIVSEIGTIFEEYPRLHKKQILRYFERELCIKKTADISKGYITRPALIDAVFALENYTGKRITDDSDAPLSYCERALEKGEIITIEDIADLFSGRECKQYFKKVARIIQPEDRNINGNYRGMVKFYIADSCGIRPNDIDEKAPITSLKPCIDCGINDYYVVVYWAECKFNKIVPNDFVETKSIKELINFFCK